MKVLLSSVAFSLFTVAAVAARAQDAAVAELDPAPTPQYFAPIPSEPPPGRPKRSRAAYGTGIAMLSTGAAGVLGGLTTLAVEGSLQSSWLFGCTPWNRGACRARDEAVAGASVALVAGSALAGAGAALIFYGTEPPARNAPARPRAELRASGRGVDLVLVF